MLLGTDTAGRTTTRSPVIPRTAVLVSLFLPLLVGIAAASGYAADAGFTGRVTNRDARCTEMRSAACHGIDGCFNTACQFWMARPEWTQIAFDPPVCEAHPAGAFVRDIVPFPIPVAADYTLALDYDVVLVAVNATSCALLRGPEVCSTLECALRLVCRFTRIGAAMINWAKTDCMTSPLRHRSADRERMGQ